MFEGENSFNDSPILEAIDKIMKYYDAPITEDDLKTVRKTKMYGKESVLRCPKSCSRIKGFPFYLYIQIMTL